jgi:hypothetical protein
VELGFGARGLLGAAGKDRQLDWEQLSGSSAHAENI